MFSLVRLLILIILASFTTSCAKFGFEDLSLLSSSGVTVLGITGGADITQDVYLFDGNIPTVHWIDEPDEDSYEVTIFENDRTTIACPTVALPQNTTSHTFLTCPLVEGRAYYAYVNAIGAAVMGTSTQQSFNVDDSFNFLYPSTVIIANSTISEGVGVTAFNVTLSAPSDWPVTIPWSTLDGTAVNSGIFKDYDQVSSSQVIITPGNTTADLNITITDDPRDEFDQDLSVNLGSLTHAKMSLPSATITIQDNDPEPTLSLSGAVVTEGDSASVTLSLSVISEKPIDFDYATQDVTATSASGDYLVINPTSVNFSPGSNDVSFMVTSLEDVDVCEFQEDIGIVISSGVNVPDGSAGTVDVQDDDLPLLNIADAPTVAEGGNLVFTATLSAPCPAHTVTFDYHTVAVTATADIDYPEQSGTITFIPNDVSEVFNINTNDDAFVDLNSEYIAIGTRNKAFIDESVGATAKGAITDNEAGVTTVKVVTSGPRTCALSSAGEVKCWGLNQYIGYEGGHYGDEPGEMGDTLPTIDLGTHDGLGVTPHTALRIESASGEQISCALLDDGRVKCWGSGYHNGTGLGTLGDDETEFGDGVPYIDLGTHDGLGVTPHTAKDISTYSGTACAILDDDRLKCWGRNADGNAGQSAGNSGLLFRLGDQLADMGDNLAYVDLGTHDGLGVTPHTVQQVSPPCAILDDGRVKCWGRNGGGELGLGDTEDRGDDPNEMGDNLPYVNLGTGRTAKKINRNCAILDTDELKCWGTEYWGRLGQEVGGADSNIGDQPGEMGDNLNPVNLGTHDGLGITTHTAKDVSTITTGSSGHTCAILDDDRLKCWGYGRRGELGLEFSGTVGTGVGSMGDSLGYVNLGTGRTAKAVYTVGDNTVVIRDDDSTVVWGYNRYGSLGLGDAVDRGDNVGEMGDSLTPVNVGTGLHVVSVSHATTEGGSNEQPICAVLNNGSVKCWGFSFNDGSSGNTISRMKKGDQIAELGAGLQAIPLPTGRTATNLFATNNAGAFCVTLDNGRFSCWGVYDTVENFGGQSIKTGDRPNSLGNNLDQHLLPGGTQALKIEISNRMGCALSENQDLFCWGRNSFFGLTGSTAAISYNPENDAVQALVGSGRKVLDFSIGHRHTCGLLDDLTVKCWGLNNEGQLGTGDTLARGQDAATSGDNLLPIDLGTVSYPVQISTLSLSSCARFANGGMKCWGGNGGGVLGLGDSNYRGNDPGEMGDTLPFINLGTGLTAKDIYSETSYGYINCVKRSDDSTVCWGSGNGALGIGPVTGNIGDIPAEMGDALQTVDLNGDIINNFHSSGNGVCVTSVSGNVKCWGPNNRWGQLDKDMSMALVMTQERWEHLSLPSQSLGKSSIVTAKN